MPSYPSPIDDSTSRPSIQVEGYDRGPISDILKHILLPLLIWRVALWITAGTGLWYSESLYPYLTVIATDGMIVDRTNFLWKLFVEGWLRWDSAHYIDISVLGYMFFGEQWPNIAFFPLYPLLIRVAQTLLNSSPEFSAILISHLATVTAVYFLYDLTRREFGIRIARRTILLLLVFPTSFFYIGGYTESLALALAVVALWSLRRQRWWIAGIAGFLLTLTRVPGVVITPVFMVEYLAQHKWNWRALNRGPILIAFLPCLGLALFMLYQWIKFGTPLAFMIAQSSWEGNTFSPPWVIPYELLRRYYYVHDWHMTTFYLLTWAGWIGLSVIAFRCLPLSYALFMVLSILPSYLTSWHRSVPRHVLIAFPAFIVMALLLENTRKRRLFMTVCTIFLIYCTILFVNAFWVA